jgi:hypothetical protein
MKFFKNRNDDLQNAFPAKPGKRFASFCIDFIIVCLFSFLVFLDGQAIAENTSSYVSSGEKVQEEIAYYNNMVSDAKLVEFEDEEKTIRDDSDVMILKNVLRAVYHSYNSYGGDANAPFDISTKREELTKWGEASPENDSISYFYLKYVPLHNENSEIVYIGDKTYPSFLYSYYQQKFDTNSSMFTFPSDTSIDDVPLLTKEVASCIYHYLYISETDTLGTTGKTFYDNFYSGYSSMLDNSESVLLKSEPYYTDHYVVYRSNLYTQGRIMDVALIVSCFIGALIGVVIPKFIFGNDRTIGRLLLSLGTVSLVDKKVPLSETIVISLFSIIGFQVVAVILFLFKPFNGVFDTMMMPLIGDKFLYLYYLLIIFLMGIVNNVSTLFSANGQSLLEMAFNVRVNDLKRTDIESDSQPESRSY